MELIPRPWGLDPLPLTFTDVGTQESHLILLLETEVALSLLLTSGSHSHPQHSFRVWGRPYPALPEGLGPELWAYAQRKGFPLIAMNENGSGRVPPRKMTATLLSSWLHLEEEHATKSYPPFSRLSLTFILSIL